MLKKTLVLVSVAALSLVGLVGCGGGGTEESSPSPSVMESPLATESAPAGAVASPSGVESPVASPAGEASPAASPSK